VEETATSLELCPKIKLDRTLIPPPNLSSDPYIALTFVEKVKNRYHTCPDIRFNITVSEIPKNNEIGMGNKAKIKLVLITEI
jgi:hypothetical protein